MIKVRKKKRIGACRGVQGARTRLKPPLFLLVGNSVPLSLFFFF